MEEKKTCLLVAVVIVDADDGDEKVSSTSGNVSLQWDIDLFF